MTVTGNIEVGVVEGHITVHIRKLKADSDTHISKMALIAIR